MRFAPMKPTPRGLWRRMPPAVFPSILGLLGVGLAGRRAVAAFGLPGGLVEAFLGAVALYAGFALLGYVGKILRRPTVVFEDLRVLPGAAGLAAAVLCVYLLALVMAPYAGLAVWVFRAGVGLHLALTAAVVRVWLTGPVEQRRVTPVWHLVFSGWSVAAMSAQGLGLALVAVWAFWGALAAAVTIWLLSINRFAREDVPAPLRPLLAVHLAPAAVLGMVAAGFLSGGLALAFGVITAVMVAAMAIGARWMVAAGGTPLWGAFTFPVAATAGFWIMLGHAWQVAGAGLLIAAAIGTGIIAVRTARLWAGGQLAVRTNAAIT